MKMRICQAAIVALLLCSVAAAQTQAVDALEGLDPVLLAQGKEVQGDLKITATHKGLRYYFASEANKALFEGDPQRHAVQFDGHCARMGAPTRAIPDLYVVHKGRIYIFGSEDCKRLFTASPEDYLVSEAGIPSARAASAEALEKGRAIIGRAVEAHGGGARIDAIRSYQRKQTERYQSPHGERQREVVLTELATGMFRRDQQMPNGGFALIATPREVFFVSGERTNAMSLEQGEELKRQFARNPLSALRARRDTDFKAAALGVAKVGEKEIERVAVEYGGQSVVLGIEAATGRVASLSYHGRAMDGRVGEIVESYDDYREVSGIWLPFRSETLFKGETTQTSTVQSITINGEIPASLFEKPHAK